MGKCLITKLNGSVQNDSLLRIGEFCIKVSKVESPTADSQRFVVNNSKDAQLRIIGDGYFTNETLSENKGKVLNITANTETTVYLSNGDYEVVVSEKYSLKQVGTHIETSWKIYKGKLSFDIDLLKYSPDISFLALSATKVTGDIAVLGKLTGLTHLTIDNTQVTGDIAVLGKLTGLTHLPPISRTKVTGDIAVYKKADFKTFQLLGTSVYGDLSVLPNNILWVQADRNTTGTFTWTGIKNRTDILAVENCKCNKIDAFLKDMATLEAKFAGEQIWYKTILMIGTRTSASDDAVQTLQNKGYTVSITPA